MNDRAWRNGEGVAPALDFATLAAMWKTVRFTSGPGGRAYKPG